MKAKFTEKFPLITGLRGDNGTFMEDGFGADGMNCGFGRTLADKPGQVRLLQRERIICTHGDPYCEIWINRSGTTGISLVFGFSEDGIFLLKK